VGRAPKVLVGLAVVLSLGLFGAASPALADSEDSTITGHVYAADGVTPLAGIKVQVMKLVTDRWSGNVQAGQGVTGSDGSYVISNLGPFSTGSLEFLDPTPGGYAEAFLGGSLLFTDATKISVGNLATTIAPSMTMVQGGNIATDLTNPDGSTPEESTLTIYADGGSGAWTPLIRDNFGASLGMSDAWTRRGADLVSPNLLPGSYRMCAGAESMAAQCSGDTVSPGTSTPLAVTAGAVTRDDFAFYSGGTLTGTLAFTGGAPFNASGTVESEYFNPDTGAWVPGANAVMDGSQFSFAHLRTGALRLFATTTVGDEWYSDAATVDDAQSINVSATQPNDPVNFTVSAHTPVPTSTVVTTNQPSSALGATAAVSATVKVSASTGSVVPAGSVVLYVDGGIEVYYGELVSGSYSVVLPADLGVGSHRLSAQFNPAAGTDFVESDSSQSPASLSVLTPNDTASGSATSKKVNGHRSATIVTTVKQSAGAPIGTLKYYLGSKVIGSVILTTTASASSREVFVWKPASVGTHHVSVHFVPKGAANATALLTLTVKVKK
jgi:hypothetical protein